jgi:hypothetical protein
MNDLDVDMNQDGLVRRKLPNLGIQQIASYPSMSKSTPRSTSGSTADD